MAKKTNSAALFLFSDSRKTKTPTIKNQKRLLSNPEVACPGLLFAGAAIGVSHLVQSTRAGADFGFSLLWVLILSNIIKYPFFLFGPKYAMATGETLLHGYKKMNTSVLVIYFILSIITMFTIQTAVTIVTAGLAIELFGISSNITTWAVIITVLCLFILIIGRYKFLATAIVGFIPW